MSVEPIRKNRNRSRRILGGFILRINFVMILSLNNTFYAASNGNISPIKYGSIASLFHENAPDITFYRVQ